MSIHLRNSQIQPVWWICYEWPESVKVLFILRHPQMYPSYHDIQLDLPETDQAAQSSDISQQYLKLVKTVKQVDGIHRKNNRPKSNGRGHGGHRSHSHSQSQSRKPGSCSNCGANHQPQNCKAYSKECFHCHKKGHFSQLCHSKQCGRSVGLRNQTNNNGHSRHDVHEIDQSKFDDSVQFEDYDYDSITIQFRTQLRHSNVMFDEISSTQPSKEF